jgi:hypothetical protein
MYELVSKSDPTSGMTVQERRHDFVRKVDQNFSKSTQTEAQRLLSVPEPQENPESTNPSVRYHIGMY